MTDLTYPGFDFKVVEQDSHLVEQNGRSRLGRITTPHGVIETPAFLFCATKGAVKTLSMEDLEEAEAQILMLNTYHLMLKPGGERVAELGDLHGFTTWQGPMMTDSGGFQIFSLGWGSVADEIKGRRTIGREKTLLKISEEGAKFSSYIDGSKYLLTPERSMQVQRQLGADLIIAFDECTPFHADRGYTRRSMERTHRWADRCLTEFASTHDGRQGLYGVLQGGVHEDLRGQASDFIASRPFFGNAIGGSLGAEKTQMYDVVEMALNGLRRGGAGDRPVHLLGIGGVDDLFEGVERGVDTFDCVSPTRIARHGWALCGDVPRWRINMRNARFKNDESPIQTVCTCKGCQRYSRAYVNYLLKASPGEGMRIVTRSNVHFMLRLMQKIRASLADGSFSELKKEWLSHKE